MQLNYYINFSVICLSFQMGLGSNGGPFGAQAYGQGATGPGQQLNPQQQLQNKATLANSLPPFASELKGAAVTSMPNMVSACYKNSDISEKIITKNVTRHVIDGHTNFTKYSNTTHEAMKKLSVYYLQNKVIRPLLDSGLDVHLGIPELV